MLTDILRSGFALAHQRVGLVFLDILWKIIWLVITLAGFYLAAAWITSDLLAVSWDETANRAVNGFIVLALVREFWTAHRGGILIAAGLLVAFSACTWILLEAFFRRTLGSAPLPILLVSNVAKYLVLLAATLLLFPVALAGAGTVAIVTLLAISFLLTILDSLIRADAVDLLGTDLFRVAALLGILMSFELMMGGSVIALLLVGFLRAARSLDALIMLGAAIAGVLFLTLLHSYLLLVRYSAIAIMRRNVVEV
jgi:hypothetical protein